MGNLEISTDGEKTTKTLQDNERRCALRRVLPEGFGRHHVAKIANSDEATFNRVLLLGFLLTLTLAVIHVFFFHVTLPPPVGFLPDFTFKPTFLEYTSIDNWLYGHWVFLAVLVCVSVWKMRRTAAGSGAPRRGGGGGGGGGGEKVQTLCAVVLHV